MGRRRVRQPEYRFGNARLDEVAAVLEVSPEATDTEICEAVNCWWERIGHDDQPLEPSDVSAIRDRLEIPQTSRKPFQKRLFEVEEG